MSGEKKYALPGLVPLVEHDPEMADLIEREKNRQWKGLELIASENFTSRAVMECLGSALTNKYAEGMPGARYYGGNQIIDQVENLCVARGLKAYRLDENNGGHLTHGFYTYTKAEGVRKPVSATSIFFESLPYSVNGTTGLIDYDKLAENAALFKPALIICGGSAYPREWDYKRFRQIADDNGALLMCDMAHISGLVAAGVAADPFEFCDVVTTTTHKSLRGPRAGMIFVRKDARGFDKRINQAVFPALQGGPHEHQIAGIATQLKEVATPEFKAYAGQVVANARALAARLVSHGYVMATGGTDNHLVLWDLRPLGLTGSKLEKLCDELNITLNKNSIYGDRSAMSPGGVRIGAPALTTRGFVEADFEKVADLLHEAVQLALAIQAAAPGKLLTDFVAGFKAREADVAALRKKVNELATSFPMPGFDVASMKYKAFDL